MLPQVLPDARGQRQRAGAWGRAVWQGAVEHGWQRVHPGHQRAVASGLQTGWAPGGLSAGVGAGALRARWEAKRGEPMAWPRQGVLRWRPVSEFWGPWNAPQS